MTPAARLSAIKRRHAIVERFAQKPPPDFERAGIAEDNGDLEVEVRSLQSSTTDRATQIRYPKAR